MSRTPESESLPHIRNMSTWSARVAARDQRRPEGFIAPCLLTASDIVPTGPGWIYEVKHDGFRLCARADAGRPRIWTRPGNNRTRDFAAVAAGLAQLGDVVLDGEAVCQRDDGHSDFHALRSADGCGRATLWAFDLLMVGGEDLRPLPVEVRRERLQNLISQRQPAGIAFSEHAENDGEALFAAACRMNLEGIVAKRKGSRYTSGRCRHWLKIKNPDWARS
jgi:bifunctional non-homologous end joining protein LigD